MENRKRIFRLFLLWQEEKRDEWLREMSLNGWHLIKTNGLTFTFEKGPAKEFIYKSDYFMPESKDTKPYFELFASAGWEHIGGYKSGGWEFFRTEAKEGTVPEIYTDTPSKIERYKRILYMNLFVFILGLGNLFMQLHYAFTEKDPLFHTMSPIFSILLIALLPLTGMVIFWSLKKIKAFRQNL